MSGGKGSSQTTSVAIPEYIEAAAQRNLNKAEAISQLGYVPYYGPDVAAFSPAQQAAFQNTAGAAGAFGLASPTDPYGGMGAPTDFGGVQGYSSAPLYQQSVDALAANRPGQKQYIDSFFIDPTTGAPGNPYSSMSTPMSYIPGGVNDPFLGSGDPTTGAPGNPYSSMSTPMSYIPGGVNDPFLGSGFSQAVARANVPDNMRLGPDNVYSAIGSTAPARSSRPVGRPVYSGDAGGYGNEPGNDASKR